MKRQDELKIYDFNINYYFSDNDKIRVLSKNISDQELMSAKSSYVQIVDHPLLRTLVDGADKYKQKDSYRFLAVDFASVTEETKDKIIGLINEMFEEVDIMEQRTLTIFFYYEKLDFNISMLLETINYDFSTKLRSFSSGNILFKYQNSFGIILNAYLEYSHKKKRLFADNRTLIMDINKENHQELKHLRPLILGVINEDEQLKKMMFTLFANNLNVTKTAEQVYMHRNTINNKLGLISDETTLNMQVFHDAVAMYILLLA